jgi:hypothetical protein
MTFVYDDTGHGRNIFSLNSSSQPQHAGGWETPVKAAAADILGRQMEPECIDVESPVNSKISDFERKRNNRKHDDNTQSHKGVRELDAYAQEKDKQVKKNLSLSKQPTRSSCRTLVSQRRRASTDRKFIECNWPSLGMDGKSSLMVASTPRNLTALHPPSIFAKRASSIPVRIKPGVSLSRADDSSDEAEFGQTLNSYLYTAKKTAEEDNDNTFTGQRCE